MLYDFCPVKKETAFRVLSVIALNENLSRKEIAESCGLSKVTAGKIVDFLACKGIVAEHTRAESSGAGPPFPVCTHKSQIQLSGHGFIFEKFYHRYSLSP